MGAGHRPPAHAAPPARLRPPSAVALRLWPAAAACWPAGALFSTGCCDVGRTEGGQEEVHHEEGEGVPGTGASRGRGELVREQPLSWTVS